MFDCFEQVATLTAAFTLEPGDLVLTGTPSGVGIGFNPRRFLAESKNVSILSLQGMDEIQACLQFLQTRRINLQPLGVMRKIVLQIALTRLARYYGLIRDEAVKSTRRRLRHWGSEDYRPTLDAWRNEEGD